MVGGLSSSGLVPIVLFIILSISNLFINYLIKREEKNNMEQEKTTMKEVANNLFVSSLFTLWTIGASVTATAVLL